MDSLPSSPEDIQSSTDTLAHTLTILFEHSPTLISNLIPQLAIILSQKPVASYEELIDASLQEIANWDPSLRAQFIAGHPRIGESKNLSRLSSKEQGGAAPTPPEVLQRLEYLNGCYEQRYPGLRYITFVNGRARAVIAEEMEERLGTWRSSEHIEPLSSDDQEWKDELNRAVKDIGLIAKSRLKALGLR